MTEPALTYAASATQSGWPCGMTRQEAAAQSRSVRLLPRERLNHRQPVDELPCAAHTQLSTIGTLGRTLSPVPGVSASSCKLDGHFCQMRKSLIAQRIWSAALSHRLSYGVSWRNSRASSRCCTACVSSNSAGRITGTVRHTLSVGRTLRHF